MIDGRNPGHGWNGRNNGAILTWSGRCGAACKMKVHRNPRCDRNRGTSHVAIEACRLACVLVERRKSDERESLQRSTKFTQDVNINDFDMRIREETNASTEERSRRYAEIA